MFSQLLNRLFESQDSSESAKKNLILQWADWLKPISLDKPTGEDLTYHDTFQEIKEEIAKLSGIDYELVAMESENILKKNSKDVRVVTYYCLARLHLDGANGYAEGVEILAGLLEKFGTSVYPSRHNIRKNAIEWLANARFLEPLTQLQPISEKCLSRIILALNQIDSICQTLFVGETLEQKLEAPDLSALVHFFSNNLKQPVKSTQPENASSSMPVSDSMPESFPKLSDAKISSQRDLLDQARKMAAFLREKPEGYLAAGRFLRILRWDTIVDLPPADHRGRTRLPAPRTELKQNISRLIIQQQWAELFERVEAAFMEGANHFWLDLQRATVMALQKMGAPHQAWADIFLADIGLMLERLNGIERLSFDNGTPFADDETLNWIATNARIHHLDEGDSIEPISISGENDWNEIEKQALELAHSESIEKAFQWLQNLPTLRSPKQRYLLQYTQARVAEQMGKQDIAMKLLLGLNSQQQTMTLLQWEPELIFDVKRFLLKLMKQKNQLKDSFKPELSEKIDLLQHELMQLDPARALSVM
ncbi:MULTISPECIES: type VI secretion system protein TssA [unclassified Gilliamella]|uniref:type VI secretion system protein TssA n=1 Tax=unclassified Gilliamella TaxID=2685620 RepID=UPI00130D30EA|nr:MULTISPECIES: type VI secretion system protein TssA [unclassified Gilliamella]MWP50319.1 type VI secretion system protein TssA [Gilliamella sp. Lep-s35]MWP70033.1 type VI secretion system protein TssA [Gilliamella sp. Lep-s5]MWP78270.1 type VI secretion system protein TssA [Gilliamella sp. Lep-s21]